jgi:hypothetical protein
MSVDRINLLSSKTINGNTAFTLGFVNCGCGQGIQPMYLGHQTVIPHDKRYRNVAQDDADNLDLIFLFVLIPGFRLWHSVCVGVPHGRG